MENTFIEDHQYASTKKTLEKTLREQQYLLLRTYYLSFLRS